MTRPLIPFGRVIGHRGAAGEAPENSLAGLRRARAAGCRWVELDVKLSREGEPVLCHDAELSRLTGRPARVADLPVAALTRLEVGPGAPIPHLDDALTLAAELGLAVNLEIKPCPGREAETAAVTCARLAALWPGDAPAPLVSSFAPASLERARALDPDLALGLLLRSAKPGWPATARALGVRTVAIDDAALDAATLAGMSGAGWPLLVFTVNAPDRARWLFERGVTAVFSDLPTRLLAEAG